MTPLQLSQVDVGHGFLTDEPSVAVHGARVFETWNFGAGFSTDGGQTFQFVDPKQQFVPASGGFCCDQLAYYVANWDMWVWVLQYKKDQAGNNTLRIATAVGDATFDQHTFQFWNWTPQDFNQPAGSNFDNPRVSATNEFLYLSANVYPRPTGGHTGDALVMRFPLAELAAGGNVTAHGWLPGEFTAAFVHGATDTMYFASHKDLTTLRVWSWPDTANASSVVDVTHSPYLSTRPYSCLRTGAPAAADWCNRPANGGGYANDDRIQTGWVSGDEIGFAWNAAQDPAEGKPYPYIMVVRLDRSTLQLIDEPIVFNSSFAFQYPAIAANDQGELAALVLSGGGDFFETCDALVLDPSSDSWQGVTLDQSDADPNVPEAGDYLGIVPTGHSWAGSCMTLHGGGDSNDVTTWFFQFGPSGS